MSDFEKDLDPATWPEIDRIHTPTLDVWLSPEKDRLVFEFASGHRETVTRSDIEALTRFLGKYANVAPLPAADESVFDQIQVRRVDEGDEGDERDILDVVVDGLITTYKQVRQPGRSGLVIFLEKQAQILLIAPDALRSAIGVLKEQGRIQFARKMNYPPSVPEAWEIGMRGTEGWEE